MFRRGMLDADEFAVARYMVNMAVRGQPPPQVLPPQLIPPSKRARVLGAAGATAGTCASSSALVAGRRGEKRVAKKHGCRPPLPLPRGCARESMLTPVRMSHCAVDDM